MGKIGDLWVRLGLKKDEFTAGLDAAQKQSQTFSQKVGGFFGGLATKVVALTAAFATVGRAMAEAARNIAGFERANSELAAVLGTNIAGVKGLSDSAKELGRTSEFTASEVTSLQVALARLGFDTGQIQNMQKSVLNFALAMGTDLGSAAEFTGSALRAFGLQSEDTAQMLDIMAASTTNSALNFSKLQTSIGTVAPIAKTFGLSVQETAAFLGVLSNSGFDASSAATALRNILLNLADANGKLAKGIGHSAKTFPEIIQAFEELREKGVKVDEILEMTDRRSAAAAAALISMGNDVDTLKDKLVDSNGALNQMAETMGDNLIGSVKALKSAWEGLTLAFEGSKGPMKWTVDRLTDILNRMTDIVGGDKVSFWEAVLGPIAGGAIAGGKKRRERESAKAANQVSADDYALPGGIGGARLGGADATPTPHTLTPEELEELRKAREKAERERIAALQAEAAEIAEVREADEAYMQESIDSLKEWEEEWARAHHDENGNALFDNDVLRMSNALLREAIENGEELENLGPRLQASLEECAQGAVAGLEEMKEKSEDLAKAITENLVNAIEDGLVGSFNALADVISGVTDGGMEQVVKALLEPLADMAIKAGTLIMMTGTAIESLKEGLINFFGGSPILAGAALIAVGVAAKAGLAAIGNRGAGASSVSSYSSSTPAIGGGVSTAELVVRVEGTVKGSDIILSGQNTLNNWNR